MALLLICRVEGETDGDMYRSSLEGSLFQSVIVLRLGVELHLPSGTAP